MSNNADKGMAASVRQRLLNLAKQRSENYNLVLTRYALERFLYRLSRSEYRPKWILKGAMLFQLWNQAPRRATRDLDLLARGDVTIDGIAVSLTEICNTAVEEDGLTFDTTGLAVNSIREDNRYGGVRARFSARLGSARIAMQIDFGVGDAVTPSPVESEYPTLLGMTPHWYSRTREKR